MKPRATVKRDGETLFSATADGPLTLENFSTQEGIGRWQTFTITLSTSHDGTETSPLDNIHKGDQVTLDLLDDKGNTTFSDWRSGVVKSGKRAVDRQASTTSVTLSIAPAWTSHALAPYSFMSPKTTLGSFLDDIARTLTLAGTKVTPQSSRLNQEASIYCQSSTTWGTAKLISLYLVYDITVENDHLDLLRAGQTNHKEPVILTHNDLLGYETDL